MKISLVKVYKSRWNDGLVHCDRCGAVMYYSCYSWFCKICDDYDSCDN